MSGLPGGVEQRPINSRRLSGSGSWTPCRSAPAREGALVSKVGRQGGGFTNPVSKKELFFFKLRQNALKISLKLKWSSFPET